MTVIAHQTQIEELRESFRQKLLEAEKLSEKVILKRNSGGQCISQDLFFVSEEMILYVQTMSSSF